MNRNVRKIHLIGICGTAMASLAAALKDRGFVVTGSDQNMYPPMSTFLEQRQIDTFQGFSETHLAHSPDLVIIGNAMSRGNPEVEAVLERKLRYSSLPEVLREFFLRGKRCLVVAGTHGKTTTTSLLTWVFENAGLNPGFLIGGISENLGQGARFTESEWFILEGDEYDTAFFDKRSKFLHYLPEVAILNNLEFDHADIFENLAAIQTSFRRLTLLVPRNGLVLANGDDANLSAFLPSLPCPLARFGLGPANTVLASSLFLGPDHSEFSVDQFRYRIGLVGEFNVRNALAVVGCARHCGLSPAQIQSGFDTFRGIKRRMEVRGTVHGVTVIDDFGHHPTAMRETLRALRLKYPGRRLWAVFEPRSNTTRRNVFQCELASALAAADAIVVSAVARADQLPADQRLDPGRLMADLNTAGKTGVYLPDVEVILDHLARNVAPGDVIAIFSNGGFGGIHQRLLSRLS
ncbi:MAG TPA: UDP-N-acetylmuramate:L-alanyl-gamma-D-glutamyl-meso-diaminopimelate ligase [Candidatus Paceibacterota bacterium]|nr:UDP-N-acetylmuramate:L-alanyl-gamma-D-glutamyl-meso-diaminopimelate ligase [Verrucomicrobiota bacterium]HRY49943.1 UDP-N-acetylmuramate:L-alanyl-gamma-D-glutamyl-meso-diaminopimelate ligase [Candidatus Paceibacterota bacterium]HSA03312.1 UDP-N-acetylmuramate:L-alanyl-gamma-D-glutamyl-meso-diaminopimelate ligase [Candidatus Paceibacterota bacterium]